MRLLIIGSKTPDVLAASEMAHQRGAGLRHVGSIREALQELRSGRGADLVLVDACDDVAGLVRALAAERMQAPVVAYGIGTPPRTAVAAVRAGALEFLPLPPDAELIAALLEAAGSDQSDFVSEDQAMHQVLRLARQVAPSNASILITGESGTGKEVLARYVHRHSRRAASAFISINCAAIPDTLLESELFGHEKGAFTGAHARRIGKFEEADGGTLLLDEIAEMDPRLQAKLLRAIQEREIDRVGGTRPVKVDIRLLATTNRNLEQEVATGRFREDLFFRLNVVNLTLPPLRERPDDIAPIAQHFIAKYSQANGVPLRTLSPSAQRRLRAHPWRGNVRELENCLHRAVLLATGDEIGPEAITLPAPDTGHPAETGVSRVGRTVADVERDLILDTLRHTLGNRTHAATILGISIRTLRNKLRQYGEEGVPVPPPPSGLPGDLAPPH